MTRRCLFACSVLVMFAIRAWAGPAPMPLLSVADAAKLGYGTTWSTDLATDTQAGRHLTWASVIGDSLAVVELPTNLVTDVSLKDGSVRWRRIVGDKFERVLGVTGAGDQWAICNGVGLYCVSPQDGHLQRMIDLDVSASTMGVVTDNLAVLPGVSGRLFTEDLTTGNPQWAYKLRDMIAVMPLLTRAGVFAADISGNAVMMNIDQGQMQWANRAFGGIRAMPAANRKTVFVPSMDSSLYAWDVTTGQDQWTFPAGEPLTRGPLATDTDIFLPLAAAKKLVALNAATGKEHWRIDADVLAMIPTKSGLLLALPRGLRLVDVQNGNTLAAADLTDQLQYALAGPDGSVILMTPQGRTVLLSRLP